MPFLFLGLQVLLDILLNIRFVGNFAVRRLVLGFLVLGFDRGDLDVLVSNLLCFLFLNDFREEYLGRTLLVLNWLHSLVDVFLILFLSHLLRRTPLLLALHALLLNLLETDYVLLGILVCCRLVLLRWRRVRVLASEL